MSFQRPDKRAVEQGFKTASLARGDLADDLGEGEEGRGEVLFADQVGVRSDQVTGRTWSEKGRTPVVRQSGNRFSVNAMSAISTKGAGCTEPLSVMNHYCV